MVAGAADTGTWEWAISGISAVQFALMLVIYKVLSFQISRLEDSKLTEIWTAIDGLRKTDAEFSEKILERLSSIPTREEVRAMLRDMKGG